MKISRHIKAASILLILISAGTAGCESIYDKRNTADPKVLSGVGCIMTSTATATSTTYDAVSGTILAVNTQTMANLLVSSPPNMTNMHEVYAGVEIQGDLSSQTNSPILGEFWEIQKMHSSVDAGSNGIWMDYDDTLDPLLGYFETTFVDGLYRMISYSDYGVTQSGRTDFAVENNRKVKAYTYDDGGDGIYGNVNDTLTRTTVYGYNDAGKMVRATNYSDDEVTFQSVYVFTYDAQGRLLRMMSYNNQAETTRLNWGSYSRCTWNDNGPATTLHIDLGWRIIGFDTIVQKFDIIFNEDGTMHKAIQYKQYDPLDAGAVNDIDTCYLYEYREGSLLSMGKMNDGSYNYSDDEMTIKSYTVNTITVGGE